MLRYKDKLYSAFRYIPVLVLFIAFAVYIFQSRSLTVDHIVSYTPQNTYLAALVVLGFFAVKSLTVFVPLTVLYIATGIIFPLPVALAVSSLGLIISIILPYFLGRLLGRNIVGKFLTKYERTNELRRFRYKNELLFSFILRTIKIIPSDLIGMVLGAERMPLKKYIPGSFIGLLPTLISTIIMGASAEKPSSVLFIISAVLTVLLTFAPLIAYPFIMRREHSNSEETMDVIS